MIRVLVVEDDKLVRHGLISAMPWNDYDMQVVGEARHGREALEFLESNDVDCVFTDLAMPIMSGIELMRILRKKHPSIHIVVLTLHQDFDYIQEALRLGAIDYIAKVQLEKERFEEVLARIRELILQRSDSTLPSQPFENKEIFTEDVGYALLSADEHADIHWIDLVAEQSSKHFLEIENSVWFWAPEKDTPHENILDSISKILIHYENWMIIRLEGIAKKNRLEVYRKLRKYRRKDFFYDFSKDHKIILMSLNNLQNRLNRDEIDLNYLKEQWISFAWIDNDALFREIQDELKSLRLPIPKLLGLLYDISTAWNQIYSSIMPEVLVAPETLNSWLEAERWFQHVREMVNKTSNKLQYSQEVVNCIMSAVKIVKEEVNQPLFAINVAKRVNMSRSYFNRCFKDIVGSSFNEYLRYLRIEKAKDYLLKTSQSIQWIAEQTGYMDEKYFSRVFRQQTEMTPSDYRQSLRNNRGRNVQ